MGVPLRRAVTCVLLIRTLIDIYIHAFILLTTIGMAALRMHSFVAFLVLFLSLTLNVNSERARAKSAPGFHGEQVLY